MKVLIVDDEVIIRTGLSTVINWKELGMELLPAAASAEEALRRLPEEQPDIMLTDIRMTGMTGIELAGEAKKLFPDMEIIILTGYDDFSYAQQAIREGVSDYLLKMSRPEEIIRAAVKAKQRLLGKWQLQKQGNRQQTMLRTRLLERLVTEGIDDPQLKAFYGEGVAESGVPAYQVALITATGWLGVYSTAELLLFAVDNVIAELLDCVTIQQKDRLLVVLRHDGETGKPVLTDAIARIEGILKCELFVAVGSLVLDYLELVRSFREADYVFGFQALTGRKGKHTYDDIKNRKGGRAVCTKDEEAELAGILMRDNQAELRIWVNQTLKRQLDDPQATPGSLRAFMQSVAIAAHRFLERAAADSGRETGVALPMLAQDAFTEQEEPGDALFKQLHAAMTYYRSEIADERFSYIPRAIAYMHEHLGESLTLQQVARHVHLNPNHFSEVFKRETGLNYLEFLTRERMNRACELLRTTTVKVSEIAGRAGYEDIKYFSQLFKKHTGQTPSEYRQSESSGNGGRIGS